MRRNNPFWMKWITYAPSDEAGAGEAGAEAGDAGAAATGEAGAAAGEAGSAKWWEDGDRFSEDHRTSLTALGLTVDDPLDALPKLLDMEASAKRRLGASPDQLLQKPKEGQDVAEWLRSNGEMLGIPAEASGYEVQRPDSWPEGAKWDQTLEDEARTIAHEEGVSNKALNRLVGVYAGAVLRLDTEASLDLATSDRKMMTELTADWGDQTAGKITQAKQAMSAIAEQAGFDEAAILNVSKVLTDKIGGDANAIRLFATIGEMMGEDSLVGLNSGGAALGTTPAEARQKLAQMRAPGGAYHTAYTSGNQAALKELQPEIERLTKLSGG